MSKEYMPRSDKGQIRINDRDHTVLRWIGEQYAVRLDILQKLLGRDALQETREEGFVRESAARRVIARWKQEHLVETRKFFFKQPVWVWLTGKGLSDVGLEFKYWKPSASTTLNHYHSVNLVRLRIETNYEESFAWHSERLLRRRYQDNKHFHIPDAELHHSEGSIGIEVELTQKSQNRVSDIVRKLEHQYEQVWYFVNQTTRPVVHTTVGSQLGERFHLYDMGSVSIE